MRKTEASTKKDYKFIILTVVSILLVCLISFVMPEDSEPGIELKDLPESFDASFSKLVISEVVSSNGGVYIDGKGQLSDYIEIYNGKDEAVDLSGYGLSDRSDRVKWQFPNGTVIQPGEYLVVSLDGSTDGGLYAGFKLSSSGKERIILTNPQMKVIDGVDTVKIGKNHSMVRDGEGKWYISEYCTPGFENSLKGLEEYRQSLYAEEFVRELVVNEFLPKNKGNFLNEFNEYAGFIEFKNVSDHSINLADFTLSDSLENAFRYKFDAVTLKPGELYYLYIGDKDFEKTNYTGFRFSSNNGSVIIGKNGKIVQNFRYSGLDNGSAYIMIDDIYYKGCYVSCGYENDAEGIEAFQKIHMANKEGLLINEIMSSNSKYLVQNGNKYYDWVELYNNSKEDINLADYYLSVNDANLMMYHLPEVTLKPGEYFVVMCSGDTNLTNNSYYHTNFRIGNWETVYLSKNEKITDCVYVCDIPDNCSYGRGEENGFFYLSVPTPGAKNSSDGTRSIAFTPQSSMAGGVYDNVESLTVEIIGPGTIYYTTDGSQPTKNSKQYSGPINLSKTTVLKYLGYEKGKMNSETITQSYIINENVHLPVMSVSIDPSDFSSIMSQNWKVGYQKQAYAEFYEADGQFSIPCSLSLFGGNARAQSKRSYCIRFDKQWGASELNYAVFDNRDNACYDALVLRSGSTDWSEAIIRDILGTSLVDQYTDIDVQAYKPAILFINGKYYGIYNIREKVNAHFVEEHYNVSKNSVNLFRIDGDITAGSRKEYNALREYARTHNLSNDEYYNYICEHFDIINLIDYWIAEGYVTNNDLLNVRLFNSSEMDGKYRYIFYDMDYAWFNYYINWYTVYIAKDGGMTDHYYENDIICNLFKNKQFRELWLERMSYNMQNTWKTENVLKRMDEIIEEYGPDIKRDRERYGLTVEDWEYYLNDLRYYIKVRPRYYLQHTKSFFGLSDERMKELFGDLW